MALQTFGVTYATLRQHKFPQIGEFTANSNPPQARVTEAIQAASARLGAALIREGVTPSVIDNVTDYPNAYHWCAETIRLLAAVAVYPAMTQQDPEVLKAWREEVKERLKELDEYGYQTLVDAPAPSTPSNGPLTHINVNDLEISDSDDMSDAVPTFRKSDLL